MGAIPRLSTYAKKRFAWSRHVLWHVFIGLSFAILGSAQQLLSQDVVPSASGPGAGLHQVKVQFASSQIENFGSTVQPDVLVDKRLVDLVDMDKKEADTGGYPAEASSNPSFINLRNIKKLGSTYIPMDSWIYPALDRLSSLGFLDNTFLGLRPWTRLSTFQMLEAQAAKIENGDNVEATEIYLAIKKELSPDAAPADFFHAELDSVYARVTQISGSRPLTSSFEFGQTWINDNGRPYARGFNAITGFHSRAEAGRFTLSFRGEFQHAPGFPPLPLGAQNIISGRTFGPGFDVLTPVDRDGMRIRNQFRILDANLSYHIWGHEISVGKSEMWLGPNQGGAFLWSTNAEPIYMLRINRVDPLYIPFLSRILGPIRYDNYFGDLKGHVSPNQPWVFGNKISIHPFKSLEIGFSRSCEFAGKGFSPLTFGTFWNCFKSSGDFLQAGERQFDVGDRRGGLDFRWRLPFLKDSVTVYTDSMADDDPSPLANPTRSAWAPGVYISHLPKLPKWDLRFEAPYTNSPNYSGGSYTNHGYLDGFTNKGNIIGYWIGRDSSGYQGWLTYWLSPKEQLQFQYRGSKLDRTLWEAGGTQTDFSARLIKRLGAEWEMNAFLQFERSLIPALSPNTQRNFSSSIQITWIPKQPRLLSEPSGRLFH